MSEDPTTPAPAEFPQPGCCDLHAAMFRSGSNPRKLTRAFETQSFGLVNSQITATEIGGELFYEGDIKLGSPPEVQAKGVGRTGEQFRWPAGVVPWIAQPALRPLVLEAIGHWAQHTPLRFPEQTAPQGDFISFEALDGCWSYVGRQGGKQQISLGGGCGLGAAIHEIGHAVGLWHEQSREDRDLFVTVLFENISPSQRHNFDKHVLDGTDLGTYDYNSIMHYPPNAFSMNGRPTIVPLHGVPIGQRRGLSPSDVQSVRMLYPNLAWGHA